MPEALPGLLGRANDWLSAYVEARIEHERDSRELLEFRKKPVKIRMKVAAHRLKPGRVVDVNNARKLAAAEFETFAPSL